MTDDGRPLDPRFDPAFQRGYAGEVRTQHRRPTIGTPSVLPAGSVGGTEPLPAAPFTEAPAARSAVTAAPPASVDRPASAEAPTDDAEPDEVATGIRVNPFVIALFALAVVFALIGVWLVQMVADSFTTGSDGSEVAQRAYAYVQVAWFGGPIALGAAATSLVAGLAILGVRWRR